MNTKTGDLGLLPTIFRKYPGIQAAYLFGSVASGQTNTDSDLDIAILPRDRSTRHHKLDILADLARSGFCNVDLVFLDTDDIVLKFEAVYQNRLLYCAEDFDASATFALILRQYFDFLPYLEVQRKAYKRRVLHDGENRGYPQAAE